MHVARAWCVRVVRSSRHLQFLCYAIGVMQLGWVKHVLERIAAYALCVCMYVVDACVCISVFIYTSVCRCLCLRECLTGGRMRDVRV